MNNIFFVIFFAVLSVSFAISYVSAMTKLRSVNIAFSQMILANDLLESYIEKTKSSSTPNDEDIHQENFIKFLSDSRDWAFDYIEDVQNGLEKFVNNVDADISYFDQYSIVLGNNEPHTKALKNISSSYKELKKLLPEESEK